MRKNDVATGSRAVIALAAVITAGAPADFIWDAGGADDLFATGANWDGGIAPPLDLAGDDFIFGPTGSDQSPDAGAGEYINIATIAFTAADAELTIIGTGSLSFQDGGSITNDSTFAQAFELEIRGTGSALLIDAMAGDLAFARIDLSDTGGVDLTVTGAEDVVINGRVVGEGGRIIKTGAGQLTLERGNTFDGGVELNDGSLVLGNNESLGTGDLEVTGDAELRSDGDSRTIENKVLITTGNTLSIAGGRNLAINGRVRGAGTLRLDMTDADDVLTLNGDNTYSGGTTINQGTIALGHDNALGQSSVTLTGDGTIQSTADDRVIANDIGLGASRLNVTGEQDLTLSGIISGTGQLYINLDGATLKLTGLSTYTGLTRLQEGELDLRGVIAGDARVDAGGTIRGDGEVGGNLSIRNGGTLAPGAGNLVRTLDVGGNYEQQTGSTYEVDIDSATGTADLLFARGTAVLEADSTIAVTLSGNGYLANGQTFTVIDADLGVTDNGAIIDVQSATLTLDIVRDADFMDGDSEYALEVIRSGTAYSTPAADGNNTAVGGALDSLIPLAEADPDSEVGMLLGTLDSLDADAYDTALQEIAPQQYLAAEEIAFDNAQINAIDLSHYLAGKRSSIETWSRFRQRGPAPGSLASLETNLPMLAAAIQEMEAEPVVPTLGRPANRTGSFFDITGSSSEQDAEQDRTGYNADGTGVHGGLDWWMTEQLTAGFAVGYTRTETDFREDLGNLDLDTIRFGPYLTLDMNGWFLDASLTGAYHKFDGRRNIPSLDASTGMDFDALEISGYVAAGFPRKVGGGLYLTPIASVQYTHIAMDGVNETGAGAADLGIADSDGDSLRTRLGLSVSGLIDLGAKIVPSVHIGWRHEFIDDNSIDARFAAGGSPFTITQGDVDADAIVIGVGVNVLVESTWFGFVRYETDMTSDGDLDWITGGLSFSF